MTQQVYAAPGSTPRTRVRRLPEKAVHDRAVLHSILDAGLVAHLAVVDDGQPYALPVGYARDGERVLVHGSSGSRLFRILATGVPTCFTVTLLDGLVLARSAFESSMNYRGVMALGSCRELTGVEKEAALRTISDHLLPGRWEDIRSPSRKELAATSVLALTLDEVSIKVAEGGPDDAEEDLNRRTWAGHVPLREVALPPVPAPDNRDPLPDYVLGWRR
jgi:nitroimidazol reductase NimA-like FMN-containing flavoprotein (pyridoxamine 5'-phosphate oxidase superfamily)